MIRMVGMSTIPVLCDHRRARPLTSRLEVVPPKRRPRQTRYDQEQDQPLRPESADTVHVFPKRFASAVEPWIHDAGKLQFGG